MNFRTLYRAAMRKRAAAVLTPEAEQAAMQGMADPSMGGGMPPQDPSMLGGTPEGAPAGAMPGAPQGAGGGQIPPEVLQDQQFIQWLAQQGVQLDQASGMFIGPDGQPLPVEAIVQAYQVYQQEMMAAQGGGAPQGGPMPPQDPSMGGGMPPQDPSMMGGEPMPPDQGMAPEQGGMPPQDPSMMQGGPMPPAGPEGGQLPPEILQDQMFMQFMQEVMGAQLDPNSGMFMDMQSGQPIPPEAIMQAYQMFQQEMQNMQGGGAPQDPSMAGGMPPQDPSMMQGGSMPPDAAQQGQPPAPALPPEIMEQFQSVIDSSIENFTSQLDKKIESLIDKLETVKMAIESMRDTDDQRSKQDKDELKQMQDDLAAELNTSSVKTASEKPKRGSKSKTRPVNVFEFLSKKG